MKYVELEDDDDQIDHSLSASTRKLQPKQPKAENKETKSKVKKEKTDISGYRFVYMEVLVLASVLEYIFLQETLFA